MVRSLFGNALMKSCFHFVGNAFGVQIECLLLAEYSLELIVSSVRRQLVRALLTTEKFHERNFAVIRYFHGIFLIA